MQFRTKLPRSAGLLTHFVGHLANAVYIIYMNGKNNNNKKVKKYENGT